MVHIDPSDSSSPPQIRQVEFNTIASSFGGLASQVSLLHKYLLTTTAYPPTPSLTSSSLPTNTSIAALSAGLAASHTHYGPSKSQPPLPLCVIFIVQSSERNVFDQRHLEYTLLHTHSIPVFRLPFPLALSHTYIPSSNPARPLLYKPPHSPSTEYEVSTIYYRAAYSPTEYDFPSSWQTRLHLERSAAIKCPTILTHLAGSKKIQQVLATPSSPHLSRFLSSPSTAERVRNTFAAIYPLDNTLDGIEAKKLALDDQKCKSYVLKPQREGGGNNIYREKIPPFLRSLGDEQKWKGHILMELIEPPSVRNSIVREGVVKTGEVIGELGIYGACLWRRKKGGEGPELLVNEEAGWLLRTKGRESEEGGVAAGFGCVDSLCLVD
jgi:glutathione synthetase